MSSKHFSVTEVFNNGTFGRYQCSYLADGVSQDKSFDPSAEGDFNFQLNQSVQAPATILDVSTLTGAPSHCTILRVQMDGVIYGPAAVKVVFDTAYLANWNDISFNGGSNPNSIDSAATSFITAGLEDGDHIQVFSSGGVNGGYYYAGSVGTLSLGLATTDTVTTENAATAGTVTIAGPIVPIIAIGVPGPSPEGGPTHFRYARDFTDRLGTDIRGFTDPIKSAARGSATGDILMTTEGLGHGPAETVSNAVDSFNILLDVRFED